MAVWILIFGDARHPETVCSTAPSSGAPQVPQALEPPGLLAWHQAHSARVCGSVVVIAPPRTPT